jgi:dihydroxy-acid dehydratase
MPSHGFSRRLTRYGDDRFARFLRDAFLASTGLTPGSLDRPVIGIATTESDFNPCHATAPQLIAAIKRGVTMAGGLPFAFPTISIHESFAYPSSLVLRNLLAMDTEEMLLALPLDAVVLVGGCDKTLPAQIMGAISADVPALVAPVGPMLAGRDAGERLGACTDCRRLWAARRAGEIDDERLQRAHGHLMPTHGTCMVMGTASTMACLSEALGFVLPGGSTIPAVHAERLRFAEMTGRRAVQMAEQQGPRAASMVTAASLRNAVTVLQALGGSTNALIHLAAIAGRAGLAFDLEQADAIGRATPVLLDLKPIGTGFMEDFHHAGGLPALMRRLSSRLTDSVMTADGRSLEQVLAEWPAWTDARVIRQVDEPVAAGEALAILRGSLAPGGAVLKRAAATAALLQHEGPALVFEDLDDLAARLDDPALPVTPEHVLVLRGAGPIAAGMPEAGSIPIPAKLARAGVKDMVRISDARMSGTAYGTVILHVAPESAAGGPLALVRDGDRIKLDTAARRLDLLVAEAELARRRSKFRPPDLPARGYARLHAQHVLQADRGCDFDFLVTPASSSSR